MTTILGQGTGTLFDYATLGDGVEITPRNYAILDFETSGFSPQRDRVVEAAIVRIEDGKIVDEWASLIDGGVEPGPARIHHITADILEGAPEFQDIAGAILKRLDGAIVVAHCAHFEDAMLAAELERAGLIVPRMQAICTCEYAKAVMGLDNYQLTTCCNALGIDVEDAHTALGDVRATAQLLLGLLERKPGLRFTGNMTALPYSETQTPCRTRATGLKRGEDGWMASMLGKCPATAGEVSETSYTEYRVGLDEAFTRGRITGPGAKQLARIAGRHGLGRAEIEKQNMRWLGELDGAGLGDEAFELWIAELSCSDQFDRIASPSV